uniref:Uncharacterized protein n=1 Tax=Mycena chlorophos TaxID=658473 RepID=A0ABQ0LBY1_MYCCL|nr:predicted protein [Mycena chlorophos]
MASCRFFWTGSTHQRRQPPCFVNPPSAHQTTFAGTVMSSPSRTSSRSNSPATAPPSSTPPSSTPPSSIPPSTVASSRASTPASNLKRAHSESPVLVKPKRPRVSTPELEAIELQFDIYSLDPDDYYSDMLAGAQGTMRVADAMLREMSDEKKEYTRELECLGFCGLALEVIESKLLPNSPQQQVAALVGKWIAKETRCFAHKIVTVDDLMHGCITRDHKAEKTTQRATKVLDIHLEAVVQQLYSKSQELSDKTEQLLVAREETNQSRIAIAAAIQMAYAIYSDVGAREAVGETFSRDYAAQVAMAERDTARQQRVALSACEKVRLAKKATKATRRSRLMAPWSPRTRARRFLLRTIIDKEKACYRAAWALIRRHINMQVALLHISVKTQRRHMALHKKMARIADRRLVLELVEGFLVDEAAALMETHADSVVEWIRGTARLEVAVSGFSVELHE